MRTKVLLVYPKIPATYWSFDYPIRVSTFKSVMPPLGLLTVASMLPKNYVVKLIDMNTTELTLKDIEDAELVFISAMIIQKESFDQVVQLCLKCHKPVVAGGPYA
ncbi:MAG: B12-binding domain-containing radical SAM protein, partial [Syntrophaceae bacterium]|nr:B12-binding domain-containing radical SAM protein [Syntrophaceae bacterium]